MPTADGMAVGNTVSTTAPARVIIPCTTNTARSVFISTFLSCRPVVVRHRDDVTAQRIMITEGDDNSQALAGIGTEDTAIITGGNSQAAACLGYRNAATVGGYACGRPFSREGCSGRTLLGGKRAQPNQAA